MRIRVGSALSYFRVLLSANPCANDDAESFICVNKVRNKKASMFSKPYANWHLAKEDELLIDSLEAQDAE